MDRKVKIEMITQMIDMDRKVGIKKDRRGS